MFQCYMTANRLGKIEMVHYPVHAVNTNDHTIYQLLKKQFWIYLVVFLPYKGNKPIPCWCLS